MKYFEYEVDPSFILNGTTISWEQTGNGEMIIGYYGGEGYFIKRDIHVRCPQPKYPKAVNDALKPAATALERKQKRLSEKMKGLDVMRDRIVVEERNFWDVPAGKFVTVTRMIPDALPADTDFTVLSQDSFVRLAIDLLQRLELLHGHGVIHGDLKIKNLLFKRKGSGYQTYLIDFDSSYPADEIPPCDKIVGSAGYMSPEVLLYGQSGDDGECPGALTASAITYATDIFTAAIILHNLWGGCFPSYDSKTYESAGHALLDDRTITIDSKFNVRIGKTKGATLMSLLNWMLLKDYSKRPTAAQVLAVLEDKQPVPSEYHIGDDVKPFDSEPWHVHKLVCKFLTMDALQKMGVSALQRVEDGGYKYLVITAKCETIMTVDQLIAAGYAERLDAVVCEPWPDHRIVFEAPSTLAAKGYAKIERAASLFGGKRYCITTSSGMKFDKGYKWMLSEGLAREEATPVLHVDGTPWPEHGTAYVPESMQILKIEKIERLEIGGQHRYKITYTAVAGGKPKIVEGVPVNNMKLMGLIK